MTLQEYKEYQKDVENFFKKEGINNLSPDSGDDNEPWFSWRHCDCCGTHSGGDRMGATGWNPAAREVQEYEAVCMDCIYYAEYGQLDDMTMSDMTD